MKNRSKIVLSAVLSIVLCLSVITGATFALFTSDSNVNLAITSGKVDIVATLENLSVYSPKEITYDFAANAAMVTDDTNAADTETNTFKNGGTAVLTDEKQLSVDLMTPGDKVNVDLVLQNNSDVHIKYQVVVAATSGTKLLDKLDVTFGDGESAINGTFTGAAIDSGWLDLAANAPIKTIPISILLNLNAGADYESEKTSLSVTVRAVQGNTKVEAITPFEKVSEGVYHINTVAGMFEFADMVNGGDTFIGKTVVLANDIDLENNAWTPIGKESAKFFGTFDGNGKTVKNLNVNNTATGAFTSSGLFGWVENHSSTPTVIKNLTIDGATVSGHGYAGTVAGYFGVGAVMDNCHVKNAYVFGGVADGEQVGGLVGNVYSTITNCTVSDSTVATNVNGRQWNAAGALYGWISGATLTSNTYKNVTVLDNCDLLISNAAQMFAFADTVNRGNAFVGKTVVLANDIDLENKPWTPIGNVNAYFSGTFDGNDKTIKNLSIDNTDLGANSATALFGWAYTASSGTTIKNLTVSNATVKGYHDVAVIAGYLNGTIDNCRVLNSTVVASHENGDACGDKAGAVVGYIDGGIVKNCTANTVAVSAARDAGQMVGCAPARYVENCTATNVTVAVVENSTCDHNNAGGNIRNEVIGRLN